MPAALLQGEELLTAVRQRINPVPHHAAIVFNSHITGLAVSRSLGRRGVPVIALDRDAHGYGLASKYATVTGQCPNVFDDEDGFIHLLTTIGATLARPAVLYPTNDEWVLAVNRHRLELERYFLIPFAGPAVVEPVLDKARLYRTATELHIPIPRTWYLDGSDTAAVAAQVPYPCIVKPTEQRSFYDAFGDKAWRIESPDAFAATLDRAAGHTLVAQEIVGEGLTDFYSVCAYIGQDGKPHGVFVGRKLEQYPPDFGTGCLVKAEWIAAIATRGVQILQTFGYHGIAEVEFIYDARDGEHKLLDVNTRVWKWIGLPIAAGIDLPWLAYTDSVGAPACSGAPRDGIVWAFTRDYAALRLAGYGRETAAYLPEEAWAAILNGHGQDARYVDAVIDSDDPAPAARMIQQTLNSQGYYCAC